LLAAPGTRDGRKDQSNAPYAEYGCTGQMLSSCAGQIFRYEPGSLYAQGMGKKENPPIGFGARLKEARVGRGLSGAQLGLGLGETIGKDASRQTISDWESERHYPSIHQLYRLCIKLGKTADELLFGHKAPDMEKVAQAAQAVQALSAEDRAALQALLSSPGVPDAEVEEKIPATRKRATHKD
jgi:transcriptional regulator with XRE-family HTH domain